jgi:3-methyl-2-oxobutanoate hydroxymethyltransferase
MVENVTVPRLQQMKRAGEKIVGVVVWDYQLASIADRAGVDIVSVGDSVGVNLWGHRNPLAVTMEQMLTVAQAVRRGTERALLSCDFPYGPLQEGPDTAIKAGIRLVKEAGVDMIKLDGAADFPETVAAMTQAGIPVWAQFGMTPQTALHYGIAYDARRSADVEPEMQQRLIDEAKSLEAAGAAMLDFTNSGPVVGPAVVEAVSIPVIGGLGGGPWLDGRIRMAHAAIGYGIRYLDEPGETYANVAQIALRAISELSEDRRDQDALRGDRKGCAVADVLPGWIRRDARQVVDPRRLRTHQAARASAGQIPVHPLRSP